MTANKYPLKYVQLCRFQRNSYCICLRTCLWAFILPFPRISAIPLICGWDCIYRARVPMRGYATACIKTYAKSIFWPTLYKLDLFSLKMYLRTKNEVSRSRLSEVTALQTYRQTPPKALWRCFMGGKCHHIQELCTFKNGPLFWPTLYIQVIRSRSRSQE